MVLNLYWYYLSSLFVFNHSLGGGLAGMSAALELAERGYQVTIREADTVLGGVYMQTKPVRKLGRTFMVDGGMQGDLK